MRAPILLLAPTPALYRRLRRQLPALGVSAVGSLRSPRLLRALPRPQAPHSGAFARHPDPGRPQPGHLQPGHLQPGNLQPGHPLQAPPQDASATSGPFRPVAPTLPSRRQRQVLELIGCGLPNKTIAARLHLSEATVKSHVRALLQLLGAVNRTEAIYKAERLGWDVRGTTGDRARSPVREERSGGWRPVGDSNPCTHRERVMS